jgi:hypothetical protein
MRDKWYSDNRDLVKWSVLLHLSAKCKADRIIQIAYYNRSDFGKIIIDDEQYPIPPEVISHFRRIGNVAGLTTRHRITVFDTAFEKRDRGFYLDAVKSLIASFSEERCIVFLDPDTGLEPNGKASPKHVLNCELHAIWETLPKEWLMVLYQHQTKKNGEPWIEPKRAQVAKAIDIPLASVKIASGPEVANDVVFFFATKA